jgi:hypothetical protein
LIAGFAHEDVDAIMVSPMKMWMPPIRMMAQ